MVVSIRIRTISIPIVLVFMDLINYFNNFSFYFPGSLNEVLDWFVLRIALKKAVGKPGTILQCPRFDYLTFSICSK